MSRSSWIMAILCILICGVLIWLANSHEHVCTGESKVVRILELQGREAKILLANQLVLDVNQKHLKPGDMYCYMSENRKIK